MLLCRSECWCRRVQDLSFEHEEELAHYWCHRRESLLQRWQKSSYVWRGLPRTVDILSSSLHGCSEHGQSIFRWSFTVGRLSHEHWSPSLHGHNDNVSITVQPRIQCHRASFHSHSKYVRRWRIRSSPEWELDYCNGLSVCMNRALSATMRMPVYERCKRGLTISDWQSLSFITSLSPEEYQLMVEWPKQSR